MDADIGVAIKADRLGRTAHPIIDVLQDAMAGIDLEELITGCRERSLKLVFDSQ
jgi:hypothetical protein